MGPNIEAERFLRILENMFDFEASDIAPQFPPGKYHDISADQGSNRIDVKMFGNLQTCPLHLVRRNGRVEGQGAFCFTWVQRIMGTSFSWDSVKSS